MGVAPSIPGFYGVTLAVRGQRPSKSKLQIREREINAFVASFEKRNCTSTHLSSRLKFRHFDPFVRQCNEQVSSNVKVEVISYFAGWWAAVTSSQR